MTLLQIMGAVAIFLAGVGVYGVLSMSVGRRLPEIGLRKALGAENRVVLTAVLRESLLLAATGAAIGVPLGIALTRAAGSFVFGVSLLDPPTLGGVVLVLGAAAFLASVIPAIRASRVDPALALREGS